MGCVTKQQVQTVGWHAKSAMAGIISIVLIDISEEAYKILQNLETYHWF